MTHWLLIPPIAFTVILFLVWLQYRGAALLSRGETWPCRAGRDKPYACGEDAYTHRVQPDYRQFFPFAFFFTIMHVMALVAATVPAAGGGAALAAGVYVAASAIGLFILFRR